MRLRLRHSDWLMGALCALCIVVPVQAGDGSDADNLRLLPGQYPADPVLANADGVREPHDPFFDVDWSVALRGSYVKATGGERFELRLLPSASLEHAGVRSALKLTGSAEIARPTNGNIDISALRLGLASGYTLDRSTSLTANGNLSVTQAVAGAPGLATNVAIAPQTASGNIELGVTRQFGRFNIGLTGGVQRSAYGPTTLSDASVVDNSEQNLWSVDGGLRVGFQATPVFEVFGVAGVGRDMFDLASAVTLVRPDATSLTLRGGITGRWSSVLEATASTGVALRRFDQAGLGEVVTQLYDARVTYTPDPTWRLTAGLSTTVAPPGPDGNGTTRVQYGANAEVTRDVNSWLALRAQADWRSTRFEGSADTETGYGIGLGADYVLSARTAVTADYGYDRSDSTTNGMQDAHTVSVGVTLSR